MSPNLRSPYFFLSNKFLIEVAKEGQNFYPLSSQSWRDPKSFDYKSKICSKIFSNELLEIVLSRFSSKRSRKRKSNLEQKVKPQNGLYFKSVSEQFERGTQLVKFIEAGYTLVCQTAAPGNLLFFVQNK